jgi:hypothetical protein
VGLDTGTPVDDQDYQVPLHFTGKITKLTIKLGPTQLHALATRDYNAMTTAGNLVWKPAAQPGDNEKLLSLPGMCVSGANAYESKREQSGIICPQIRGTWQSAAIFRGPLSSEVGFARHWDVVVE